MDTTPWNNRSRQLPRASRLDSRADNLWTIQGRASIPVDESSSGITIPGTGSARTAQIPGFERELIPFVPPGAGTNSSVCRRQLVPIIPGKDPGFRRELGGEFGAAFTRSKYEVNAEHQRKFQGVKGSETGQLLPVGAEIPNSKRCPQLPILWKSPGLGIPGFWGRSTSKGMGEGSEN